MSLVCKTQTALRKSGEGVMDCALACEAKWACEAGWLAGVDSACEAGRPAGVDPEGMAFSGGTKASEVDMPAGSIAMQLRAHMGEASIRLEGTYVL